MKNIKHLTAAASLVCTAMSCTTRHPCRLRREGYSALQGTGVHLAEYPITVIHLLFPVCGMGSK